MPILNICINHDATNPWAFSDDSLPIFMKIHHGRTTHAEHQHNNRVFSWNRKDCVYGFYSPVSRFLRLFKLKFIKFLLI